MASAMKLSAAASFICIMMMCGCDQGGSSNHVLPKGLLVDFEKAQVGKAPLGFTSAVTNGTAGTWEVTNDNSAPSGSKVVVQTSIDRAGGRFPLLVYDGLTAKDVAVAVMFKPLAGQVDQAAGLAVRFQDASNYYVVRANALENNVRLYKVEAGKRVQFAGCDAPVAANKWQRLRLEVRGSHFKAYLDAKLLFEADDATFSAPGKIGLWTKADSVTAFDDLSASTHD